MKEVEEEQMAKAVVTIHDVSTKIFRLIEEIDRLDIKYNIALMPFFNEKQDLPPGICK
ncbi:MAG: hypothetical protein WCC17_09895 [Candidatus Nitrosopolaris sp.]|jgi:hypothetical protein